MPLVIDHRWRNFNRADRSGGAFRACLGHPSRDAAPRGVDHLGAGPGEGAQAAARWELEVPSAVAIVVTSSSSTRSARSLSTWQVPAASWPPPP